MTLIVEALGLALISSLILYNIKRTDQVDSRLDQLCDRMARVEVAIPKRKGERNYYSENSGIDL